MKHCQICKTKLVGSILNLGKHPLCDDLIKIGSKKKNKLYKIIISYCTNCFTAFQTYNVNKKKLFPNSYHYRASLTKDVLDGMRALVLDLKKKQNLKKKIVLDIGCNDGSLLNFFKKEGCKTIGIEPTNAFLEAKKFGHEIYNSFFDEQVVKKIVRKNKKIDIITFTNVFAHIENFKELINNLKSLVTEETILIIENHYLGSVIDKCQFDTFYHEHPRTYSLNSFVNMQRTLGMNLFKFSFPRRYSGNIRVYFKKNSKKLDFSNMIRKEKKFKQKFTLMQKKILKWKKKKKIFLNKLFLNNGPLPAKAFPGRAAIILNCLKLKKNIIKCVYEKNNSPKNNYYVPGTRIPIFPEKKMHEENNKVPFINLAWHISKEIKLYIKSLGFKNKVIDIIDSNDFR